jgi:hypothetical protein
MRLAKGNPSVFVAAAIQAVSKAIHDGAYMILSVLTGHTITLPAAIGSRARFQFVTSVAPTSNSNIIKVQNSTDRMIGQLSVSGTTTASFAAGATDDTITVNRTTTGGAVAGDTVWIEDVLPGIWLVYGQLNGSGAVATPFSSTV